MNIQNYLVLTVGLIGGTGCLLGNDNAGPEPEAAVEIDNTPPNEGLGQLSTSNISCPSYDKNEDAYLERICEYIVENFDYYNVDPRGLSIKRIDEGPNSTTFVFVDCCHTGDWGEFDNETKEILTFNLGAI